MDLSRLNAFMVVAEELNFRRSAERLGMSQPPLTRIINALEEELGTKLFERTTRKVDLTAAGLVLFKESKALMTQLERLEADVRAIGKLKRGSLKVGFSQTAFLARLPKIIDEFKMRLPGVTFELKQEGKKELLKALTIGKFDLGFLEGDADYLELSKERVRDEVMGVLVPRDHKFAKKSEIDFSDLKNETLILHPKRENGEYFDRIQQLLREAKIKPDIYIKKANESCPILVATGAGVLLTISNARSFAMDETRFVPIRSLFMPVSVYWRAQNPNPSLKGFLSVVSGNHLLREQTIECLTDVQTGII